MACEDVTTGNIDNHLNFSTDSEIIFDTNGSIIDYLFGTGASYSIAGVALPWTTDAPTHAILQSIAIINAGPPAFPFTSAQINGVMVHEFGHFINLSHTQVGVEEGFDGDPSTDTVVPTMFPFVLQDESQMLSLSLDDAFSVGTLYPYPSGGLATFGEIQGNILRGDGSGVQAVNVVCRSVSDPRGTAVSWLSDLSHSGDGNYTCGGLASGNYTVEIESSLFSI
jgi:hypothetical protein